MSRIAYVEPSRCDQSPMCPAKRACPQKAISQVSSAKGLLSLVGGGVSTVDPAKCTGCRVCLANCPRGAISMVKK